MASPTVRRSVSSCGRSSRTERVIQAAPWGGIIHLTYRNSDSHKDGDRPSDNIHRSDESPADLHFEKFLEEFGFGEPSQLLKVFDRDRLAERYPEALFHRVGIVDSEPQ